MAFEQSTEAVKVLEGPRNRDKITQARQQESQLRVFTETYDELELRSEYYYTHKLLKVIQERSQAKFQRVKEFFRFPLPIVQIADAVLNDFFKIFDGKNRYFDVQGDRDINRLREWIVSFNPELWIENNIKGVFKNKPNSYVIVDADENGPYLINIDSNRLIDVDYINQHGDLNYIAFIHSIGQNEQGQNLTFYGVYCSRFYRVFSQLEGQGNFVLFSEVEHNIGYCPARPFISTPSSDKNYLKRRVAFTESLSRLEDFTIFDVFSNYVDHYAPFPVTEAPESPCQNQDCENGKIRREQVVDPASGRTEVNYVDCTVCDGGKNKGQFVGPGLHIGVPISENRQVQDARGVFKIHFPDVQNLSYVPEKLDKLAIDIKNGTVGVNGMITTEAINEMQAKGGFESMESVIIRNKTELDILYKWIVQTVGRWFYTDIDLTVEANFGTEFFLVSENELQNRFERAKEIGLPIEEQVEIYMQIIETKYKGNPAKIERQKLLLMLDPLPLITPQEAIELAGQNLITPEELSLKLNFLNLITKFESENGPLSRFGTELELPQRLEIIRNTLINFNNQNRAQNANINTE